MAVEIRRTSVTPTEGGSVVHVHISDAPLEAPFGSIELQMTVSLPEYARAILLAHAQREALLVAQDVLSNQLKLLAQQIQEQMNLRPKLKSDDEP